MLRIPTVAACVMVAILLVSSDANACHRRGATYSVPTYDSAYGRYAPATSYAPSGAVYGYGGGYAPAASYAPSGPGYGYDVGRPGYNPGGLGGPRSGLGVRPGVGFGGFGLRR
jgi:hypothetical protein